MLLESNQKNPEKDPMMQAWTEILATGSMSVNFLNRAKLTRELEQSIQLFGLSTSSENAVPSSELNDFALRFLTSSVGNKAYRSTVFGLISMKDHTLALKIASEIDRVTRLIPASFHLENALAPLHTVMVQSYRSNIENGDSLWEEYIASLPEKLRP